MVKSDNNATLISGKDTGDETILAWSVHVLHEKPGRLFLIVPVIVLCLLVSFIISRSILFPAVTLLLLAGSLGDYLFPVRYEITSQGASAKTLFSRTTIGWDAVKKYYIDEYGIKLSPLRRQTRLEAYRGVYLRFGSRRDEVAAAVRRMRDAVSTDS